MENYIAYSPVPESPFATHRSFLNQSISTLAKTIPHAKDCSDLHFKELFRWVDDCARVLLDLKRADEEQWPYALGFLAMEYAGRDFKAIDKMRDILAMRMAELAQEQRQAA